MTQLKFGWPGHLTSAHSIIILSLVSRCGDLEVTHIEQLCQGVCKVLQDMLDLRPQLIGFELVTISKKIIVL